MMPLENTPCLSLYGLCLIEIFRSLAPRHRERRPLLPSDERAWHVVVALPLRFALMRREAA
jgi:hypothetical protein